MSDSRDARPGAPAAPRPAANAPKPPAVSVNRPATTSGAQSPRAPLAQNSRAPTPPKVPQAPVAPQLAKTTPAQTLAALKVAQTPAASQVEKSSPPPPATASKVSEPPESGWDDATQVPSSAVIPAVEVARAVPPALPNTSAASEAPAASASLSIVPVSIAPPSFEPDPEPVVVKAPPAPLPVTPARAGSSADLAPAARRARSSPDLKPDIAAPATTDAIAPKPAEVAARIEGLPQEMQDQLFGVLRSAFDASLLPLLEKQRELEARLEWLHRTEQRAVGAAGAKAVADLPEPAPAQAAPKPLAAETPQAPTTPSLPPKPSLIPTSYGYVIESGAPPRRPSIEVALENVGPIDVPDFGRRRSAGSVLVALLLAGVVAAVAATILSYT